MKSYATTSTQSNDREFIMKESAVHWRYDPQNKGTCVIRVVPMLSPEGKPEPLIKEGMLPCKEALTDSFIEADTVVFFGNKKYSMICPPAVEGERMGMVHHFVNYIKQFCKNNPRTCPADWMRWQGIKDEGDREKPPESMRAPTNTLFVQGYLIEHNGEKCTNKQGELSPKYPVVLCSKPSGRRDLMDKLLSPLDDNAPWGSANNKLGDILDLDKGRDLHVIPYDVTNNNRKQIWYKCEAGEVRPLTIEDVAAVWQPWESILDLHPSIEEIGIRLAMTFDAKTVLRVFEECPVYSAVLKVPFILEMAAKEEASSGGGRPVIRRTPITPLAASVPPPVAASPTWAMPKPPLAPTVAPAWVTPTETPDEEYEDPEDEPVAEPAVEAPAIPPAPATPASTMEDRIKAMRKQVASGIRAPQ